MSHWNGDLPKLEIWTNWAYSKRFDHLFGRLTYLGLPVYGFLASSMGAPSDSFGRNIYVDTYNSAYGPGWRRENSFLSHRGTGVFCYGFYPHDPYPGYPAVGRRPAGRASATARPSSARESLPDVSWEGAPRRVRRVARPPARRTPSEPCTAATRSASPL